MTDHNAQLWDEASDSYTYQHGPQSDVIPCTPPPSQRPLMNDPNAQRVPHVRENLQWITDCQPTPIDANSGGYVMLKCDPYTDAWACVHWSHVGRAVPWASVDGLDDSISPVNNGASTSPLTPSRPTDIDGIWISSRTPTKQDANPHGLVRVRNGGMAGWSDVPPGVLWRRTRA